MFLFKIDEQNKLVHLEVSGIMSVSDAAQLSQELLANASAARRKFGSFKLLINAQLFPVQPLETMNGFIPPGEVLQGDDDRYAVVVGSTLSKLQASRVLDDDRAKAFLSMAEGESWLSESGRSTDSE